MSSRRLPHFYPPDRWLFVTWHLHGSLPARYPPPSKVSAGQAFLWIDRQWDVSRTGPMFLRQERVATVVVESLYRGVEVGHYELAHWVIMANHVPVLLLPRVAPSRLLKSLQGSTAGLAAGGLSMVGRT